MNPLFDAALYRSTLIRHTPEFYVKPRTCRGEAPPSCYARPFGRLKAPLGLSLFRCAAQPRTCRGEAPPSCYARPFGRLKAPLGLSLLRFAAQTRTCRGGAPPSCLRKTVRSLKSPTGAFIAPLRCANANNALFALHKILHRLA